MVFKTQNNLCLITSCDKSINLVFKARVWYLKLVHLGGYGGNHISDHQIDWEFFDISKCLFGLLITPVLKASQGKIILVLLYDIKCWEFRTIFTQVLKQAQSYFLKKSLYLSVVTCGWSANPVFFAPFIPTRNSISKWAFCPPAEIFYISGSLEDKYSQWPSFGRWGVIGSIACNF